MKNFTKIMYVVVVMATLSNLDTQSTGLQLAEAQSSLAFAQAQYELTCSQAQHMTVLKAVQRGVPSGRIALGKAQEMVARAERSLGKAQENLMFKNTQYEVVRGALSVQEARNKVAALGMQALEQAWTRVHEQPLPTISLDTRW